MGAHQTDQGSARRVRGISGMSATGSTTYGCLFTRIIQCGQSYLLESINERKSSDEKDEKRDLLSNLVNANGEVLEDGEQRLDESELLGTRSALGLPAGLFTHLSSRKHVHFLRRWT